MVLLKKTDYNTEITDIEGKVPDVSTLVTKMALTTAKNKIHDVSGLVKKIDYNTKVTEIENKINNHNHDKYVITPEFNTSVADVFNARLPREKLVTRTNFDAINCQVLSQKLLQIKQNTYLLKMN